jgi:hypothetical protein
VGSNRTGETVFFFSFFFFLLNEKYQLLIEYLNILLSILDKDNALIPIKSQRAAFGGALFVSVLKESIFE